MMTDQWLSEQIDMSTQAKMFTGKVPQANLFLESASIFYGDIWKLNQTTIPSSADA